MSDGDDQAPNPFSGLPFFADMMRAMSAQGPLNWDLAVQFAGLGAKGDEPDPEPDTTTRLAWDSLADVAAMHVTEASGLPLGPAGGRPEILTVSRSRWAQRTLTDLRPLFTALAAAISASPAPDADESDDPMAAMFSSLTRMMAPALAGMSVGSMVGALARHALGQYELPIPRPGSADLLVVAGSVDSFADEWNIAGDDLRMWVLVHELASHAVLSGPAMAAGLGTLIVEHASAFSPDPSAIMDRLGDLDPSDTDALSSLQEFFSDPMVLMGAMRSPAQEDIAPRLDAAVAAVSGWIDHVVDASAARILGTVSPIAEAVRRRRVEWGDDARFIEGMLGVSTSRAVRIRGRAFVDGVVERGGESRLALMTTDAAALPTPNEIDAPGLWLARLGFAD